MWLQLLQDSGIFSFPLLAFWVCGLAGILIDIDHPISFYLVPKRDRRFFHTPILVADCIILCSLSAYIGGLLVGSILI